MGALPGPLIDVLGINPEQVLLLPQNFKLRVYDLVDLTSGGMRLPGFCVPLRALIVYAYARIGPSCGSILRPLRSQTICHVELIYLMIPGKYVIDKALNKVSITLTEMLEVAQMSLSFALCPISPPRKVHEVVLVPLVYILIILVLMVQPRVHLESWRESRVLIILGKCTVMLFISDSGCSDRRVSKTWEGPLRRSVYKEISLKFANCCDSSGHYRIRLLSCTTQDCSTCQG